jgi:hypothetical protein
VRLADENSSPRTETGSGLLQERDIWATASLMIKRYGDAALFESTMRADRFLDAGDLAGARVWKRIAEGVDFLSTERPALPSQ